MSDIFNKLLFEPSLLTPGVKPSGSVKDADSRTVFHTLFNNSLYDVSDNNHSGTKGGSPSWIVNQGGQALQLGTSDYVNIPAHSDLQIGTADFLITVMVTIDSLTGYQIIVGKDVAGNRDWTFGFGAFTANKLMFSAFGAANSTEESTASLSTGLQILSVARRGTSIFLYRDGVKLATTTANGSGTYDQDFTSTNKITIGRREYVSFEQPFSGSATDVSLKIGTFSDGDIIELQNDLYKNLKLKSATILPFTSGAAATAAITGTMTASVNEDDITTGGKTIIITLTGDTWKAAGTGPIGSTADTQALIDGFDAATSPTNGWNNEVRDKALTSEVVRTSDTVATWTVAAQSGYDIASTETITGTIPTAALATGAGAITATPTFTVDAVAAGATGKSHPLMGPFGGPLTGSIG